MLHQVFGTTSSKFTHKQDIYLQYADVVELVDTPVLELVPPGVKVQVLSSVPEVNL